MIPFVLRMAWREAQATRRRLALYMGSITLGVAALVAINSFRDNVSGAITAEARNLLGADIEVRSRRPFPPAVRAVLDSAAAAGVPVSYATSFASMALAERSGLSRLVEVRAIAGGFPYYGIIETDPPGVWPSLQTSRWALVDQSLLVQLDAAIGDTLAVGEARFVIGGAVTRTPGEIALRTAIGPRVYIPAAYLEETELLRFGSLARYLAFLKIDDITEVQAFLNRYNQHFRDNQVGYDTVAEREDELRDAFDALARFLGLVGLIAVLLGGVGVASAVNVFVKDKLPVVAVLRCLGATQRTVFAVYLLQAALMGLLGSAAGVGLGLIIQTQLPQRLGAFLPIDVAATPDVTSALAGLGVGVWVAVIFALLPLLAVRNVSPLAALRRDFEPRAGRADLVVYAAYGALALSLVALSLWQAPGKLSGLAFAGALTVTAALLWASAVGLSRATRRFFPRRARYVIRQGVANLFRPQNQTVAVTLAVGFGVFLIATLYVVQRNLLEQFQIDMRPDRPNLVLFDIQTDQRAGVVDLLSRRGVPILQQTPMISARIAALNGTPVASLLSDSAARQVSRWALRREYRNTYRDTLVETEELVAGEWWDGRRAGWPRISVEIDVAGELGVGLGDRITWDIQGVMLETEIASLRRVNWARFEPNFFVVFEPGALERAPQNVVVLLRVNDPTLRAELQRDVVRGFSNVAVVDLTLVQQTLDTVIGSIALAVRFMALFSLASGLVVLVGAIATSRFQRMKESALLKTLGASQAQIGQIIVTEYWALGALAALTGILLASVAGWSLTKFLFEVPFRLPAISLAVLGAGAALTTTAVGLLNSWHVFRTTPLAVIRELGE